MPGCYAMRDYGCTVGFVVQQFRMEVAAVEDIATDFTIREMRREDVEEAGIAYYTAYYVDSLATGVPLSFTADSPEAGARQIELSFTWPESYNVVAVNAKGKVLGGAFMHSGTPHSCKSAYNDFAILFLLKQKGREPICCLERRNWHTKACD